MISNQVMITLFFLGIYFINNSSFPILTRSMHHRKLKKSQFKAAAYVFHQVMFWLIMNTHIIVQNILDIDMEKR